jgi:cytochrome c551/c552
MVNKRIIQGEYAESVSFTVSKKHVRMLKKIAKKYKSRSDALRNLIEQEAARMLENDGEK